MNAFVRFSRPHTVIGTTLSVLALYALALSCSDFSQLHLAELALTLISCLGANIYIVGLNQVTDVDIDRINKPYLPLASGEFSMRTGYSVIGIAVLVSLAIALFLGNYLLATVLLSLLLGTAYSLPPLRLKRFAFWAAFCIIAVRGLIVNMLLFLHFNAIINEQHHLPLAVWLLTATIFIYSIAIAWFKDIPDMEGDRTYHIKTLSLRVGARKVFLIGNGLIICTHVFLWTAPFLFDLQLSTQIIVAAHLFFFILLMVAARRVHLEERKSVFKYYQFIWVLFFLEYISFAAAGLAY